ATMADAPVAGLPLGHCRLVEVGRALAGGPDVVLLDEPFSGLDGSESAELATALTDIVRREHAAMVLVDHDVDIVLAHCAQLYVLDFGRVIAEGTPESVRRSKSVRAAYLGEDAV